MSGTIKTGIGQDSHAFDPENKTKPLILGGVVFNDGTPPLKGNSDADVVFHALANALSGITCVNIIGTRADEMCRSGITDSREYVYESLKYMNGAAVTHVSLTIECLRPHITPMISAMRTSIAHVLNIPDSSIGITATTGEGLTSFGQGLGIQVFCIVTVVSV